MKRKEIVTKLIKEGFSEKTLASKSDKELKLMSNRVLSEQGAMDMTSVPGGNGATAVTNVSKNDIQTQNALKQNKKPFATYEGEMSEEDDGNGSKYEFLRRIEFKLEHETDETKKQHLIDLLKRIGYAGDGYDSNREKEMEDEEGFMKDQYPPQEEGDEFVGLNEWVDHLVGKNVHPFTSKTEILSLITKKLHEQEAELAEPEVETLPDWLTYDAIMASGAAEPAEPKTRPRTDPNTTPDTDDPYKPNPGEKTRPKANNPAPAKPRTRPTTKPGQPEKDDPYNPSPGIKTRPKAEKR